jgi:hypothetical protein
MSIESIPSEIIAMILGECIRAIDIHAYTSFPSVLNVCRQWRMLAFEHPDCWSMINVIGSGPYLSRAPSRYDAPDKALDIRLVRWISLARNHPLDVSIWKFPLDEPKVGNRMISWKTIASKVANAPRFNTYWEIDNFHKFDFLPSLPPESFLTLTHLRLNRSNIFKMKVSLPQLKVLCSVVPPVDMLECPVLENFTIASLFSNYCPTSLATVAKTIQAFPMVRKLVCDELYLTTEITSEDMRDYRVAFSKIKHLAIGSVSRQTLLDLLTYFSSASTLLISDITSINPSDSFDGKNLKELVVLEHPSSQLMPATWLRPSWQESWAWRFFDCLPELRTFRIGRRMHFEDLHFKFYWPHIRNSSEVRWIPAVLSAFLCALGLRKERHNSLHPFRCPKLEDIYLTCIHLDNPFIEYLMDCLRLRHESEDTAVKKPRISTTKCTADIGPTAAFPDVSELSYPEFKEVFDKHDTESRIFGSLFDPL